MAKNNILIFLGIALIMVSAYLIYAQSQPTNPADVKNWDLICQVSIENPLFFDSKIKDVQCITEPSGLLSFSLSDIYTDKGNLEMSAQGKTAKTNYEVVESQTVTKKIKLNRLTPGSSSVTFNLRDTTGKLISSKIINQKIGGD